ncbi:histidine kinase [Cytobacillus sp. IB215316]|uniref:sensor histidine kinase n=1 Tax=Cytobacillus sp. IB215316 TaxID=3097354 RepID=UPI002A128EF7|nr:histidine kinase [Cytobacillus sp. IB215316]MDX8362467.1 histidine kinase [Cytobacillus sp. IB215316]
MKSYSRFKISFIAITSSLIVIYELIRHKFIIHRLSYYADIVISSSIFIMGIVFISIYFFNNLSKLEKKKYEKEKEAKALYDSSIDGIFLFNEQMRLEHMNQGAITMSGRDTIEPLHLNDLIWIEEDLIDNFNKLYYGKLIKRNGDEIPISISASKIYSDHSLRNKIALTVRDLSSQKELEATIIALYTETAKKQYQSENLFKLSKIIISLGRLTSNKHVVFQNALTIVNNLLGCNSSSLLILNYNDLSNPTVVSTGKVDKNSILSLYREKVEVTKNSDSSLMFLKLQTKDKSEVIGYLILQNSYTPNNEVLTNVLHTLSISLENVFQYEKIKEIAIVEERERLSREMHDGLAQAISSMKILLEYIKAKTSEDHLNKDQFSSSLYQLDELINSTYNEIRQYLFELRLSKDTELSLFKLIDLYRRKYMEQLGVDVQFEQIGILKDVKYVTPLVKMHILRILQEVFNNINKHAQATSVKVSLLKINEEIHIKIKDNGIGFENLGEMDKKYGLKTIHERAKLIHGNIKVDSKLNQGTSVELIIPIDR